LAASLLAPLYFFFVNPNNFVGIFLLYLFIIISIKHRENIKRLMNGSENKIKLSK
jgi:glycerol-3-phosphate acyltransferase PlsY